MNASRLREIVELLIEREGEYGIQGLIDKLNAQLSQLAGSPQSTEHQTAFTTALNDLQAARDRMVMRFEPSEIALFDEIGAAKYFVSDFPADIWDWAAATPMAPAVAQEKVQNFVKERQQYIGEITSLRNSLTTLGIAATELEEGTAEIGFLIPRELFDNQLDQLIKKLGTIRQIIRIFSEIAGNRGETVQVREISTSDPLFNFLLATPTIVAIGAVITWGLDVWERVERIRKLRADTAKTEGFSEDEIESFFGNKIKRTIEEEIEGKVEQLLRDQDGDRGRMQELRNGTAWALEAVLAHIERGLRVEIRYLPPPPPVELEEGEEAPVSSEETKFAEIISQLKFPSVEGTPILNLPPPEPDSTDQPSPRNKATRERIGESSTTKQSKEPSSKE